MTEHAEDKTGEEQNRIDQMRKLIAMFRVRDKKQFSGEAAEVLRESDRSAVVRHPADANPLISEEDLLLQLAQTAAWKDLQALGLPPPEELAGILEGRQDAGIDENGVISLERLDARARRVIHAAHALAQQRGVFPIGNRVMLAALLAEKDSYAARACRAGGVPIPPEVLCQIIRATIDQDEPAQAFALSREACDRLVIPVLSAARRITPAPQKVTERELFVAFCEKAAPPLKQVLRERLCLDLDRLKNVTFSQDDELEGQGSCCSTPVREEVTNQTLSDVDEIAMKDGELQPGSGLDPSISSIVNRAAQLAASAGRHIVNSPHLFAAMMEDNAGPFSALLRQRKVDLNKFKTVILSVVPSAGPPLQESTNIQLSPNTRKILDRAKRIAHLSGGREANAQDLFTAFFADDGGVVGQLLMSIGMQAMASGGIASSTGESPGVAGLGDMFGVN